MTDDPWALTYEDDPAALSDERLAYQLLCGVEVRLPNGRLDIKYYPPGSEWDRSARAACPAISQRLTFSTVHSRYACGPIRPGKRDCPSRTTH
jgi:hypothetical protein